MSLLKIVTLKKKEIIILHVANFAFPTSLLFIVREVLIFSHLFLDHLELNSNKFVNVKKKIFPVIGLKMNIWDHSGQLDKGIFICWMASG